MEVKIKDSLHYVEKSNYCVCCGTEIPEGAMICSECEKEVAKNDGSFDHVLSVIRAFCKLNEGDDATINIILTIGAEILDISPDKLLLKI